MKCHLFLIAILGVAVLASPVPLSEDEARGDYDAEYDPDCVEGEGDEVIIEPEPVIKVPDVLPGKQEPAIRIPIDNSPDNEVEEEDCEDPLDTTQEPATPEPTEEAECEATTTEGPPPTAASQAPNPCDDDPCLDSCPQDCSDCPDLPKCNPCLLDVCGDGCEQPCDQCAHLDLEKCNIGTPTPTCADDEDEIEPTAAIEEFEDDRQPAHVLPDDIIDSGDDVEEDCVEELE